MAGILVVRAHSFYSAPMDLTLWLSFIVTTALQPQVATMLRTFAPLCQPVSFALFLIKLLVVRVLYYQIL